MREIFGAIDPDWDFMVWEEMLHKYNIKVYASLNHICLTNLSSCTSLCSLQMNQKNTVVQVWIDPYAVETALKEGFEIVYSKNWYLNELPQTRPDWHELYNNVFPKESDFLISTKPPGSSNRKKKPLGVSLILLMIIFVSFFFREKT